MPEDDQSLVLPPRKDYDIVKLQEPTVLEEFLEHPLTASLEAITGAFANGSKGLMVSAGRIAQGLVRGQIYEGLAYEWRRLREAGKLPDNLGETKHGLHTWAELMKIIDDECPDADRLQALKAAFYAVNKMNASDKERISAYQIWHIAKRMTSGEVILLKTVYDQSHRMHDGQNAQFEKVLAEETGFGNLELLHLHGVKLSESALVSGHGFLITTLGKKLIEMIRNYDLDLQSATSAADAAPQN